MRSWEKDTHKEKNSSYLDDDRLDEEMLKKKIVIYSLLRIINISNVHQCQIPVLQMC